MNAMGSCTTNKYENCFKKIVHLSLRFYSAASNTRKCIMEGYTTNAYQCIIKTTT